MGALEELAKKHGTTVEALEQKLNRALARQERERAYRNSPAGLATRQKQADRQREERELVREILALDPNLLKGLKEREA